MMSVNPLHKKLQLNINYKVLLLDAPQDITSALKPLPEGCSIVDMESHDVIADWIIAFVNDAEDFEEKLDRTLEQSSDETIIWVAYAKGGQGDLDRDGIMEMAVDFNLRAVSQVALSDVWSAMRLRIKEQVKSRPKQSKHIDFEDREIKSLPDALSEKLEEAGLSDAFEKLSYTRKKEMVLSVEQAKEEETRQRRLDKIIKELSS